MTNKKHIKYLTSLDQLIKNKILMYLEISNFVRNRTKQIYKLWGKYVSILWSFAATYRRIICIEKNFSIINIHTILNVEIKCYLT